jgi:Stage II sporulation protein E (SpoIIE)
MAMGSISTRISTAIMQFASMRGRTAPLNAIRYLQRQPRFVRALASLGLFVLIAWIDLLIDNDLSLFALYLIAVGDVSGKGFSSAQLMASLQGLVRMNLAVHEGKVARFVTQ